MSRFAGKLFRGALVLSGTQAVGQVCSLGRNIIVARLLSPADFGVAAIFLMTVNLMDMISNMSLDRLLVQAEDGDDEPFQQTAQGLSAVRGLISAVLLMLLAYPMAHLFNVPDAGLAFVLLGLVPLLMGFAHLDPKRVERHLRFWPNALVDAISQVLLLMAAWPLAAYFQDYRAMLWLLVLRSIVLLSGSHLVADRAYRLCLRKDYLQRFFKFGWPLLLNGVLLFLVFQGDRFLLGSAQKLFGSNYDMADVGVYSAAFLLAMVPGQMLFKIGSSLFLPALSRVQDTPSEFKTLYLKYLSFISVVGVAFGVCYMVLGETVVLLVYGDAYAFAGTLVGWLGLMWVVRLLRMVPTLVSMANGNTKNLLYCNILRLSGVVGSVCAVALNASLFWLPISGIFGELLALLAILKINRKYFVDKLFSDFVPILTNMLALCLICGVWLSTLLPDAFLLRCFIGLTLAILMSLFAHMINEKLAISRLRY